MDQNVDVFISHHTSSCLPVTQAICNHLENSGIRCWYAPRDTEGAYAACITSAIERCRVFVLVLNRQSSASQDVLNEINLAVERIRKGESLAIIPFQISRTPSAMMPSITSAGSIGSMPSHRRWKNGFWN